MSPFKDLKCAVLTTLSLVQTGATKGAIINSKMKRVQHRTGELMIEPNVIERLHDEELEWKKKGKCELWTATVKT